jgi:hypothetical protein
MSILVHRATDEIDRLEMFALAKSEEGQSVLIARIEHLESVLNRPWMALSNRVVRFSTVSGTGLLPADGSTAAISASCPI